MPARALESRQPGDASDTDRFAELTGSLRRELLVHCYRMLGSLDDAQDTVQETYLRAWRSLDSFAGRASMRVWLYRIATNACLSALSRRNSRRLPSDVTTPTGGPPDPQTGRAAGAGLPETEWLQPIPGILLPAVAADPAVIVDARSSVRLAFVAALQHLPARLRAVLILRDVLAFRAAETAEMLGTTTAAVNNALPRARARLAEAAPSLMDTDEPSEPHSRALVDQYTMAFQNADIDTLIGLLRADVTWQMPPQVAWYAGRAAVGRFIAAQVLGAPGDWLMVPTSANGQPAVAAYLRGRSGIHHAHGVQVLALAADRVAGVVTFLEPGLFTAFGLPAVMDPRTRPVDQW